MKPDDAAFTIKDFDMGIQIGAGAFGIVRRVTHKTTRAQLALKSYDKKNLTSDEISSTVQSEINNLSDLRHPSIMRLYEVIDEFS